MTGINPDTPEAFALQRAILDNYRTSVKMALKAQQVQEDSPLQRSRVAAAQMHATVALAGVQILQAAGLAIDLQESSL